MDSVRGHSRSRHCDTSPAATRLSCVAGRRVGRPPSGEQTTSLSAHYNRNSTLILHKKYIYCFEMTDIAIEFLFMF